jgi:hypothetical protein
VIITKEIGKTWMLPIGEIRMINKLTSGIFKLYHAFLIIIALASFSLLAYFWKIGFLDGSQSKRVHEASFILETLDTNKMTSQLQSELNDQNPKLAIEILRNSMQRLETVNDVVDIKDFEKFNKNSGVLEKDIHSLISYPKTTKIFDVFNTKMQRFAGFTQKNNWRSLNRMSDRILGITNSTIEISRLEKSISSIERDFDSMIKITKNSVLSRADKSEILSRISSLRVEMTMLKNFSLDHKRALLSVSKFGEISKDWFSRANPKLALKKMELTKIGKFYIFGLLAVLSTAIVMLFIGMFFQKRFLRSKQEELEKEMQSFVSESLIEKNDEILESFSEDFQNYTLSMRDYIGKRMSYGSIFQEAIPLGSILLDKNLKVIWANKHFLQDWQIPEDDITRGYISWDYLSKLTNLGDSDPIIEALKFQVAGIYQVQVKVNDESETWPYEMFCFTCHLSR